MRKHSFRKRQRQASNLQAIFSMAHQFSRLRRYNHFGTLAKQEPPNHNGSTDFLLAEFIVLDPTSVPLRGFFEYSKLIFRTYIAGKVFPGTSCLVCMAGYANPNISVPYLSAALLVFDTITPIQTTRGNTIRPYVVIIIDTPSISEYKLSLCVAVTSLHEVFSTSRKNH